MEKAAIKIFWEKGGQRKKVKINVFDNDGNILLKRNWSAPGNTNIFRKQYWSKLTSLRKTNKKDMG